MEKGRLMEVAASMRTAILLCILQCLLILFSVWMGDVHVKELALNWI